MRNYIFYFILILGCHTDLLSQTQDTLTTPIKTKSPRNAMIYSAICPGLGQWYNEQKIKSVVVFGGEIALVGNSVFYNQKLQGSDAENEILFYENLRSQFIWYAAALYLLNILDAYVDAHLFGFDVGPDLSSNEFMTHSVTYSMQLKLPLSSIWRLK